MLSLKDRIDLLESDMKKDPPAFIMSRQLPFAIFRYDPDDSDENEWKVRQEIQNIRIRVQNATHKKIEVISLADLFWKSIRESEGIESLVEFEKSNGFESAERLVNRYLSDDDFRPLVTLLLEIVAQLPADTAFLFLVHATVFAPAAYRISSLLEQLSGKLSVPAVLFYPGKWENGLNYMGLRSVDQALGSYRVKIYGRE
ncbi:DUF1788 domain-containing protein [bacterium]|nr:DUF1788 domain-containing protein [bacterium]